MSTVVTGLRAVVTDPIVTRLEPLFRGLGPEHDWRFVAHRPADEQSEAIALADVLVCSRLSAEDARRCRAGLVHVTGSGTDRVALDALVPGTQVLRTGHHERSIAEHVLLVVLAHHRRLAEATGQMRDGTWRSVATDPGTPMHRNFNELTIGLVGFGGIGQQTMELCSSLGAKCVAVRRSPRPEEQRAPGLEWVKDMQALPELLAVSDVVVLGVPLTERTTHLIGAEELGLMKPDALLVNVSRGPVIDQDALHEALTHTRIGGAALDVWWGAPEGTRAPASVNHFAGLPNVIATPHNSGHAQRTFEDRIREIVANINAYASSTPKAKLWPRG